MRTKQFVVLALILIIMIGLGNGVAYAASLCVHPTGAGRCFTSIQAAVDAANSGDQIVGTSPDVFSPAGLLISGMDSNVWENRFRKLETGILLFVDDPQLGSVRNTAINRNRFDQVMIEIMAGPGAPVMLTADNAAAKFSSCGQSCPTTDP